MDDAEQGDVSEVEIVAGGAAGRLPRRFGSSSDARWPGERLIRSEALGHRPALVSRWHEEERT
ncbi:MAG: hypothetical protein AAGA32_04625, partial [Pseudomonadota bacterium]